jgi:hypothetical protein
MILFSIFLSYFSFSEEVVFASTQTYNAYNYNLNISTIATKPDCDIKAFGRLRGEISYNGIKIRLWLVSLKSAFIGDKVFLLDINTGKIYKGVIKSKDYAIIEEDK